MALKGFWNAFTNTPRLATGVGGVPGDVYIVSVEGTNNIGSGLILYKWNNEIVLGGDLIWRVQPTSGGTGGTVTSVGLSMPSIFTVFGSPITGSGNFAVSLNTELANKIFAGPSSGGAATPTFRTLVNADMPAAVVLSTSSYSNPSWITALAWSKITSTPTTLSGYGITDAVPEARTITIDGITFDLSANRSWTTSSGGFVSQTLTSDVDIDGSGGTYYTYFNNLSGFYAYAGGSSIYIDSGGVVLGGTPGVNADKFVTNGGTSAQFVKGDGSLDSSTIPTVTPSALTKTDDTNVTLTLGGTPSTSLLQAVSLTLGWTGTLADARIASASTWNSKQAALSGTGFVKSTAGTISYDTNTYYLNSNPSSFIALTALSATSPIFYSNTTGVISSQAASASQNGYLTSTDWSTFNSKGSGTVTSVSGTTNRITSTGGATPVIDISATFEALLGKVASPLSQFAATTSAQLASVISDETGSGALVFATSPTLTTAVLGSSTATTQPPADNSTKLATTAYVDNAILGQRQKEAVKYASISALPSIVYANGSSGVGATLTGVALAAISLDSSSPSVNDRVLIKNQASTFQNGIYTVTATGSGIAVFVLTRATDFDQAVDIQTGDAVFITAGSTLANTTWTYNAADNPVIGTDPITFVQSAGPGSYTAGNGISITGVSIAIDTSITVDKTTAQTLTNKTLTSPILTTPALGTPTSGVATNLTGLPLTTGVTGVLPVANGGTNVSSASITAFNNITGYTAAGATGTTSTNLVFSTSPTLVTPILGTPTSGTLTNCTFPTLNQNSTGSAASLSVTGQTGLFTVVGLTSTNRAKTVRDAADTILELGGSYTPTGTWTSLTMATPVLGTPTSGTLTNCTTTVPAAPATTAVGFLGIPQRSVSAATTTTMADAGGHLYHPSADTTARIWTIDSNTNVAYPIGTTLTFINDTSAGVITIAITSDTMILAGAGTTGSRTLAANGIATAVKMTSTRWIINGTGLT